GLAINDRVRAGKIEAPIVIGRDHLDTGSVASPYRETEAMRDGSDAIADWPLLNALLNTAAGASWVSIHNGGGVGIGYAQHAGMDDGRGMDVADLRLEQAYEQVRDAVQRALADTDVVVYLGGDNGITRPGVHATGSLSRCGLLTLDAHLDLRDLDHGLSNVN